MSAADKHPWWLDAFCVREMVANAKLLTTAYPHHDLFGIGQSPAWLLRTTALLAPQLGHTTSVAHVPFTGNFRKHVFYPETTDGSMVQQVIQRPKHEGAYRAYLTGLGLSPQNIVQRFDRTKRQTVIVDYVKDGNGFASFVSVLTLWAKEQKTDLNHAVMLHTLHADDQRTPVPYTQYGPAHAMTSRRHSIAPSLINSLRESSHLNAQQSDRIVPVYAPDQWGGAPSPVQNNAATVEAITERLIAATISESPRPAARAFAPQTRHSPEKDLGLA